MIRITLMLMACSAFLFGQGVENDIKGSDDRGNASGSRAAVGPDGFGYVGFDETEPNGPTFNFIDISGTGADLGLAGDDAGVVAPIGFTFNFYGVDYTDVAISTNGYLNFNTTGDLTDFGNDCPGLNSFDPDQSIYVYWDDMAVDGTAYMETFGSCPNTSGGSGACTVFMWEDIRNLGSTSLFNMEVILYQTGNILMQYGAGNSETGDGATIGLENQTPSTIALDYACNTAGTIPANRAILFQHPLAAITVPTMGTTGIIVFIAILALSGLVMMARRRKTA